MIIIVPASAVIAVISETLACIGATHWLVYLPDHCQGTLHLHICMLTSHAPAPFSLEPSMSGLTLVLCDTLMVYLKVHMSFNLLVKILYVG